MADHTRYPTPGGVENAIKDAAKRAAAADSSLDVNKIGFDAAQALIHNTRISLDDATTTVFANRETPTESSERVRLARLNRLKSSSHP